MPFLGPNIDGVWMFGTISCRSVLGFPFRLKSVSIFTTSETGPAFHPQFLSMAYGVGVDV